MGFGIIRTTYHTRSLHDDANARNAVKQAKGVATADPLEKTGDQPGALHHTAICTILTVESSIADSLLFRAKIAHEVGVPTHKVDMYVAEKRGLGLSITQVKLNVILR